MNDWEDQECCMCGSYNGVLAHPYKEYVYVCLNCLELDLDDEDLNG